MVSANPRFQEKAMKFSPACFQRFGAVFGDSDSEGYGVLRVSDCGAWLRTGV